MQIAQEELTNTEAENNLALLEKQFETEQADYNKRVEEFNETYFTVEGGLEVAKKLYKYLIEKSEWKSTESFFIIEVEKRLKNQIEQLKTNSEQSFAMKSMDIEAFHYFLGKHEGKGYHQAFEFYETLKPILDAMQQTQAFKNEFKVTEQKLQDLAYRVEATREGLEMEKLKNAAI